MITFSWGCKRVLNFENEIICCCTSIFIPNKSWYINGWNTESSDVFRKNGLQIKLFISSYLLAKIILFDLNLDLVFERIVKIIGLKLFNERIKWSDERIKRWRCCSRSNLKINKWEFIGIHHLSGSTSWILQYNFQFLFWWKCLANDFNFLSFSRNF